MGGHPVNALWQSTCFRKVFIKIYKLLGLNYAPFFVIKSLQKEDKDGDDAATVENVHIIPHTTDDLPSYITCKKSLTLKKFIYLRI